MRNISIVAFLNLSLFLSFNDFPYDDEKVVAVIKLDDDVLRKTMERL